jgi:hypothetical protein
METYTDNSVKEWVKDKGKFERGVAYATTELANRGPIAADRLYVEADGAIDYDDFDRGILSVLRTYGSTELN